MCAHALYREPVSLCGESSTFASQFHIHPLHDPVVINNLLSLLGILTACSDAEANWHMLPAQACLVAWQLASYVTYFCWLYTCGPLPLILSGTSVPDTAQDKCLFSRMELILQAKLLQTPKQGQNPPPHKASLTPTPLTPAFQWHLPQKVLLCLQHRLLQQLQRQTLPVSPRWKICQNMANLLLTTLLLHPLRSGS